jgi:hypothetical protein
VLYAALNWECRMADIEAETDAILKRAWDVVVRRNPMLMAKMRPDYDFKQLKDMIRDCLEKGLSVDKTFEHTVAELLETARSYTQPSPECSSDGQPASA